MLKKILSDWHPKWYADRFKVTLVAIVIGAVAAPLLILAIPYLELFNDMAVQPKGKAQGQYGWFSDEQLTVERPPVPGTIPVTYVSHPYPKDEEKNTDFADRFGREVKSPYAKVSKTAPEAVRLAAEKARRAALKRGEAIFNRICITCHGQKAEGDGPIVGPDLFPAPPTLRSDLAKGFADGHIYHVITRGQKKMPSYADVLDPDERWAVILYVRALQWTSGGEK